MKKIVSVLSMRYVNSSISFVSIVFGECLVNCSLRRNIEIRVANLNEDYVLCYVYILQIMSLFQKNYISCISTYKVRILCWGENELSWYVGQCLAYCTSPG